jgi:hypothetical protein
MERDRVLYCKSAFPDPGLALSSGSTQPELRGYPAEASNQARACYNSII